MILVETFYAHNELKNYSYLVLDKITGKCWVIDPYDSDPIIKYIKKNGLHLSGILNTHHHWDHVRGNAPLVEAFSADIISMNDRETMPLDTSSTLKTLSTPGHTMDHKVYLWETNGNTEALFSGDTLFNSGVGNCRNGGNVNDLYETTMKLQKEIPKGALLYPGHDYRKRNLEFALTVEPENQSVKEALRKLDNTETHSLSPVTLGEEFQMNPFFRLQSHELKENVLHGQGGDERELFTKLRTLRDAW